MSCTYRTPAAHRPKQPFATHRMVAGSRERGQALILAVICMLVFVVGVLVLFNTGQVVNKKVQLNNTADAAAYSAAVQQARAYNLISYLNRAQVANEVAVAQMVSMHSWMNFGISATDHLGESLGALSAALDFTLIGAEVGIPLGEVAQLLEEAKQGMQELRDTIRPIFSAAIAVLSDANIVYSDAAKAVTVAEVVDIPLLVQKVVKANTLEATGTTDKAAGVDAASFALLGAQAYAANDTYVRLYNVPNDGNSASNPRHTADADRYANVVMEARDGFSAQRNGDVFFLHKRGGTDLVSYNRWVAMDTLNAKLSVFLAGIHINIPLAWGGAAAIQRQSGTSFSQLAGSNPGWTSPYINDRGHKNPYGGAATNDAAGSLAKSQPATPSNDEAILTGYRGLQSYEDIAANKAIVPTYFDGNKPDSGPIFTVVVEQAMSDVRTTSNVANLGGPPELVAPDKTQNDKMTALATGQVYFDRPKTLFARADNQRELGSLFSPYWQARLVDTPKPLIVEIFGASAVGL